MSGRWACVGGREGREGEEVDVEGVWCLGTRWMDGWMDRLVTRFFLASDDWDDDVCLARRGAEGRQQQQQQHTK